MAYLQVCYNSPDVSSYPRQKSVVIPRMNFIRDRLPQRGQSDGPSVMMSYGRIASYKLYGESYWESNTQGCECIFVGAKG